MEKTVVTSDSACDIPKNLKEEYGIFTVPLHIESDGKEFLDGVNITPDMLFERHKFKGTPKTSAVSVFEYEEFFSQFISKGYNVLHISLSSRISSSYANAVTAKNNVSPKKIIVIDSLNLSSGITLLALKASEILSNGMSINDTEEKILTLRKKVKSSFVLDKLDYMKRSGRCSAVQSLGANILSIKPSIEVDRNGMLVQSKKYRGDISRVREQYVYDRINGIKADKTRVFVTHSGLDENELKNVCNKVNELYCFEQIIVNRAGCTISAHCGPGTLGVLFMSY